MMLYTFAKKDGNVIMIGADSSVTPELDAALLPFSQDGFEPATEADYFAQETGVLNTRITELETQLNSAVPVVPPVVPTAAT